MTELSDKPKLPAIQRVVESKDKASVVFNPQGHWYDRYLEDIFLAVGRGEGIEGSTKLDIAVDPETNSITLSGTANEVEVAANEIHKRQEKTDEILRNASKRK